MFVVLLSLVALASAAQFVVVTNVPPVAVCDIEYAQDVIVLNASRSYDADGDSLLFLWIAPSPVTVSDPAATVATIDTANLQTGTYQFILCASDRTAITYAICNKKSHFCRTVAQ